jgi:hypothetical protein
MTRRATHSAAANIITFLLFSSSFSAILITVFTFVACPPHLVVAVVTLDGFLALFLWQSGVRPEHHTDRRTTLLLLYYK